MNTTPIETLVLHEFRLSAVDSDGAVARIVAATPSARPPTVPLLTSIDDRHDVATIESRSAGDATGPADARHALLDPFVAQWQPEKRYVPRITEQSQSPPSHYRLAVTESGINGEKREPAAAKPRGDGPNEKTSPLALLWVGQPVATYAGLLILLGSQGGAEVPRAEARDWPLLMSRRLGVRIYDSGP